MDARTIHIPDLHACGFMTSTRSNIPCMDSADDPERPADTTRFPAARQQRSLPIYRSRILPVSPQVGAAHATCAPAAIPTRTAVR